MTTSKATLTKRILIALVLGIVFGVILNALGLTNFNAELSRYVLVPVGRIFTNGIMMLVVPLVLCSLICGAASIGDIKKLGRVGGKIITFYLVSTALAITIALIFASIIRPGIGTNLSAVGEAFETAKPPFIMDIFVNMIPRNPIAALANMEMLQIIFFAIIFGVGITLVGESAKPLLNTITQINEVLLKIIALVMLFAPFGVFALISNVIMNQGVSVLIPLLKYALTITAVLLIQVVVIYGGALKVLGKTSPIKFFKNFWPVMMVAFSTSSSGATIPVTLKTCEEKLGVSKSVASFTIPLGATMNMDGTAIMQGVATLFLAQLFGVEMTIQSMLMIVLTATLASIGTAGVPGAGMVMLSMVLLQVGISPEGIPIILSVDRILDMMRTAVNVTGDAVGTMIVARSEGELNSEVLEAPASVEM
jgi:Na+/H+-dicarboxylate symporter